MTFDESQWYTVEEAAQALHTSTRQVHRYGEVKRLQTRRAGRRTLFYRADVDGLADELGVSRRPAPGPRPPKPEMVPAGELLQYLRQKDAEIDQLQREIQLLTGQLALSAAAVRWDLAVVLAAPSLCPALLGALVATLPVPHPQRGREVVPHPRQAGAQQEQELLALVDADRARCRPPAPCAQAGV